MKRPVKVWEDPLTVMECLKELAKEYRQMVVDEVEVIEKAFCILLKFPDGYVLVYWKEGFIWEEFDVENNNENV